MARIDATRWPDNPYIKAFLEMPLVRRQVLVDDECNVWVMEVRKDARTGEKQRLTYMLVDTHGELH